MQMARVAGLTSAWVVAVGIAACSLAPDYRVPDAPSSPAFKEGGTAQGAATPENWRAAAPADAVARGAWWSAFGDPELDALQDRLSVGNQNLKAALARLEQARAEARIARADLFPQIGVNAGATRQQTSKNRATYSALQPHVYNDFNLSADLSYELDLWGRVRNTVAAARATAEATAADTATAELSLRSELAIDFFMLRAADTRRGLLDDAVVAYDKALTLTRNRHDGGVASAQDVDQAETQLRTAQTQFSDNALNRAQLEHAIAVLIGEAPANFSLEVAPLSAVAPPLDAGLPSTLLERRPDIAAGERRVASANAQIGVARAAYFPTVSFNAAGGLDAGSLADLFEAPSALWSFGPSAAFTVLDFGRRSALTARARAVYDEAVADYRQSVLQGYQDVEDNLVALHRLEDEQQSQRAAVAASQRALQQANNRYRGGLVTYLEVVTAQNTALQSQLSLADIDERRVAAAVQLIKAVGGGWSRDALATAIP